MYQMKEQEKTPEKQLNEVEPRKMVQMNRFAGQKLRYRCREQTYGHLGGKAAGVWGWWCDRFGDWD